MDLVGTSPLETLRRTEINCHACHKNFVAELDVSINGNYCIECAHCGHEHYRTIKDGAVTESRYDSSPDNNATRVSGRSVWKSTVIKATTSSVSHFLRERWLNRSDFNGR
jgi:hypothetical protein